MPGSDLYLDRNTCSLTALALSPSVLFHFILFSVKIIRKIISTQASRKMVNAHTLQQKYKPSIELPENSLSRLYKAQYRNQHEARTMKTFSTMSPLASGQ